MRPLLSATGLWQGPWNLFSPIPDSSNHRIRADLYFTDGTHHVWNSPEWKTQTAWQRFVGHRDSEFIEKIWEDENSAAWPRFAEFLMQQERQQFPSLPPPDRIALSVILTEILPPDRTTWSTLNSSTGPRHERVFFTLVFPE